MFGSNFGPWHQSRFYESRSFPLHDVEHLVLLGVRKASEIILRLLWADELLPESRGKIVSFAQLQNRA